MASFDVSTGLLQTERTLYNTTCTAADHTPYKMFVRKICRRTYSAGQKIPRSLRYPALRLSSLKRPPLGEPRTVKSKVHIPLALGGPAD
jgi:hypothetical protein